MYSNNKYNFTVENVNKQKCHILFYVDQVNQPKINSIRENIKLYDENLKDEFIIILRNFTNSLSKLELEKPYPNVLWYKKYIINITKHIYVPKHELVDIHKENEILKMYNLNNKNQLMYILKTDPICKYYNFKQDRIIKISRKNGIVYRYIK